MPFRPVAGLLHFLIEPFHILQFVKVVACPPFYFLWFYQEAHRLTPPFKPAYGIAYRLHEVFCNVVHHMFYILKLPCLLEMLTKEPWILRQILSEDV